MVYKTKTLELCHKLTKDGEEAYQELLKKEADEILFKHQHPILWILGKIYDLFKK